MKKRRSFSRECKREAVGMVLDQGFSYREVCRQLDLGETVLWRCFERGTSRPGAHLLIQVREIHKTMTTSIRIPNVSGPMRGLFGLLRREHPVFKICGTEAELWTCIVHHIGRLHNLRLNIGVVWSD